MGDEPHFLSLLLLACAFFIHITGGLETTGSSSFHLGEKFVSRSPYLIYRCQAQTRDEK